MRFSPPRLRYWHSFALLFVALALSVSHAQSVMQQYVKQYIDAHTNIFAAGHADSGANGGGMVPHKYILPPGKNRVLTFSSATGAASCCGSGVLNDPKVSLYGADGNQNPFPSTDIMGSNGISGLVHADRTLFLTGVFLTDTEPSGATPPALRFSTDGRSTTLRVDFTDLSPCLNQTFFIGDGHTGPGNNTGSVQKFHIPDTATQLFLGYVDGLNIGSGAGGYGHQPPGYYDDNAGGATVTFAVNGDSPSTPLLFGLASNRINTTSSFPADPLTSLIALNATTTGATSIRFDLNPSDVPSTPDAPTVPADNMVSFYVQNNMRPLGILETGTAPVGSQALADFAAFVKTAVTRYKGCVPAWEIWNEPNITWYIGPGTNHPDVLQYAALLQTAYTAAHQADPSVVVAGPTMNQTDLNWLLDMGKLNAFNSLDAVSFHPYSLASDGPEEMDLARQIRNVSDIVSRYRSGLPLWITEFGFMASLDDAPALRRAQNYMAQAYAIAASEGVERLFWFSLTDLPDAPYGLLNLNGTSKDTFTTYILLARTLGKAKYQGYLPLTGGAGIAYVFAEGANKTVLAWAHRGRRAIFNATTSASVHDLNNTPVASPNGVVQLTSMPGETPLLITQVPASALKNMQTGLPPLKSGNVIVNGDFHEYKPYDQLYLPSGSDELHSIDFVVDNLVRNVEPEPNMPYAWARGLVVKQDLGNTSMFRDAGTYGMITSGTDSTAVYLSKAKDAIWQSFALPAVPGERYVVTLEVKTTGNFAGDSGVELEFFNGPGTNKNAFYPQGHTAQATIPAGGTNGQWMTLIRSDVALDEDGTHTGEDVVRVNLYSKNNPNGTVLFRNVKVTRQ